MNGQGMDKVVVVSADGHCGPPAEQYRDYLDPAYHGALEQLIAEERDYLALTSKIGTFSPAQLRVVDRDGAIASGGLRGAWDVDRRIAEMDREGIAAELLLNGHQLATSPFFGIQNNAYPADVRMAGARAYNRWQADVLAVAPERFVGIVEHTAVPDLGEVVREIEWGAARGFRGVVMPGAITDKTVPRPPFYSPYWEPFWAACAEADLALVLHVGLGPEQGLVFERNRARAASIKGDYRRDLPQLSPTMMAGSSKEPDLFALNYSPRQVLWELLVGGVFDRFPNLRYVPTEARADWLPATLARMDARYGRGDTPLRKPPSEYWRTNGFAGASFIHRAEIVERDRIGVDTLMFGRDYPHPEGTWPNSVDWIRVAFADTPEGDARKNFGDLLGRADEVEPDVVDEFDKRGGFRKALPELDTVALDGILDSALTGVGAGPDGPLAATP